MARESERPRARESRERSHHHERKRRSRKAKHESSSSQSGSQLLSADALAQLDHLNQHRSARAEEVTPKKTRRKRPREFEEKVVVVEKARREHRRESKREHQKKSTRIVSGALLEEGDGPRLRGIRGGDRHNRYEKESFEEPPNNRRKCKLSSCLPSNIEANWSN